MLGEIYDIHTLYLPILEEALLPGNGIVDWDPVWPFTNQLAGLYHPFILNVETPSWPLGNTET